MFVGVCVHRGVFVYGRRLHLKCQLRCRLISYDRSFFEQKILSAFYMRPCCHLCVCVLSCIRGSADETFWFAYSLRKGRDVSRRADATRPWKHNSNRVQDARH